MSLAEAVTLVEVAVVNSFNLHPRHYRQLAMKSPLAKSPVVGWTGGCLLALYSLRQIDS